MTDVAPQHGGKVFGICNTWGSMAGIAGNLTTGRLLDAGAGYAAVFGIMIGLYVLSTVVWNLWCSD